MYTLIRPFLNVCFLNAGPQDLPASRLLLGLSLAGYFLVGVLLSLPVYGLESSVVISLFDIVLLAVFTYMALWVIAYSERLSQTLCALAGCGALLGAFIVPVVYLFYRPGDEGPSNPLLLLIDVVLLWLLVVYGHIFRQALSTGIVVGILISFAYLVLSQSATRVLFPLPVTH